MKEKSESEGCQVITSFRVILLLFVRDVNLTDSADDRLCPTDKW